MKFNHLNVPTHWRNYWSRYPEGHTILEALISWVSQVDSMVDNQNKLNDNVEQFRKEIDEFVGRFDERLQDEVIHTLKDWQDSGFLDVVISEALQWELDNYIATNEQDKLSINQQFAQTIENLEQREVNISQPPFNITPTNSTAENIQQAIDYCVSKSYKLLIPAGIFEVESDKTLIINGSIIIEGVGRGNTVIKSAGQRSASKILIAADNVTINNIDFDENNTDQYNRPAIEISKGHNITIINSGFTNGHTAIWGNPLTGETIKKLKIINCEMNGFSHNIYLGGLHENNNGSIDGVFVNKTHIYNGKLIGAGGDGIKTIKRVSNIFITDNIIEGQSRDAIDLFANGYDVVIKGNLLKNNTVKAIDIKSDVTNYPTEEYGYNGRDILISDNIIVGNNTGVAISQSLTDGDYPINIKVNNNIIKKNTRYGITASGRKITISNNNIYENGTHENGSYHAVMVGDNAGVHRAEDIQITNNNIYNNGNAINEVYGIYISARTHNSLINGNIVRNDVSETNPFQHYGLYINIGTSDIAVKNNQIYGHYRDVFFVSGAGIIGEVVRLDVKDLEQDFAGFTQMALFPNQKQTIFKVSLMSPRTYLADSVNHNSFTLRKTSGNDTGNIAMLTNSTTDFTMNEIIPFSTPTITRRFIDVNEGVTLGVSRTGSGMAMEDISIFIELINH